MASSILFVEKGDLLEIPMGIRSLGDFRQWSQSADFPESGRIDYLNGNIEVDMSPENAFYHGTPKGEVYAGIHYRSKQLHLGHVFVDAMRIVYAPVGLSAEPDVVLVLQNSLDTGRVRFVEGASNREHDFVEIEGAADLVVEIVSDGSVAKDTKRLPVAYYEAGVQEYWLIDARGEQLSFRLLRRGETAFEPTPADENGFMMSQVLNCRCRLDRSHGLGGYWQYDLVIEECKP